MTYAKHSEEIDALQGESHDRTVKCADCKVDEFIKTNYRPVDDKSGYVWLDRYNYQIIELNTLKKSICDFCAAGYDICGVMDIAHTKDSVSASINTC